MSTSRVSRIVVLLAVFLDVANAHAQTLSEKQIDEAIAFGKTKKSAMVMIGGGDGGFGIGFQGPYARVAAKAAEATEKYLPFGRDQIDDELLSPLVSVTAYPMKPSYGRYTGWTVTGAAKHLVLQVKAKKGQPATEAIQPTKTETFPVSWSNAMGGKFESQGIAGWFAVEDIPTEEFDVVVVTGASEFRYSVKPDRRAKIR